jgi:hypothetical protein
MINKIGITDYSGVSSKNSIGNTNANMQIFFDKTNTDTFSLNNTQQENKSDLSFKSRIVNNLKKADPEFTASALCFASALISPVAGEIFLAPLVLAFLIPIIGKVIRQ